MIKALIFDMGGVLVKNPDSQIREDIEVTLRLTKEQVDNAWKKHIPQLGSGLITEKEFWKLFFTDTKASNTLPYKELLFRSFKKNFSANTSLLAKISELKKKGFLLGVISNTIAPHRDLIEKEGILKDFDVLVFSYELGFRKPQKEIYISSLKLLGVKPEESIYIDDVDEYVEAAIKLGMNGVTFKSTDQTVNDFYNIILKNSLKKASN